MTNEIELIPSEFSTLAEEAPKVTYTLGVVEGLTRQVAPLMVKARSLKDTVKYPDREGYQAIGAIVTEVRGLKKQGEAHLSPFETLVSRIATFLRTARQKHTNACTEVEGVCLPVMKAWERAEIDATAKEQKVENKTAEKQDRPAGTVQHNIPSTAGYRRSTLYRADVENEEKFWRALANNKGLRQYLSFNVQEAQRVFREEVKDAKKMAALVPGWKFWTE